MDNIEYVDNVGSYEAYEYEAVVSDWDEDSDDEVIIEQGWTVWHVFIMLALLVVVAALLVYVVLPYITTLTTATPAVQLPTPVQA